MKPKVVALSLVFIGFSAGKGAALVPAEAKRLLDRAGLGSSAAEEAAYAALDREAAVDRLLAEAGYAGPAWSFPWLSEPPFPKTSGPEAQRERRRTEKDRFTEFTEAWVRRLCRSPDALGERLALFWHNYFTSSFDAVKSAAALVRQDELIRRRSLGNFREFLVDMTVDPAMMVYLDTAENSRTKPNENFARELLELFSLGEGNYGEADIREAARALAGLRLDEAGAWRLEPRRADDGVKTIFGKTGRFGRVELIDLVLEQDAAARYLPSRLFREFVGRAPQPAELAPLAAAFRAGGWEIRPLVRAILLSEAFWDAADPPRVRSPAELLAATVRLAGAEPPGDKLAADLRRLEQPLGDPISVKGWPEGAEWINADAVLARTRLLEQWARKLKLPPERRRVVLSDSWQFK